MTRGQTISTGTAVLLFVAVYILPLGLRPLSNPDELRYGAVAHEMLASGDWVSPKLNGVRYFEKPVLGYWLDAASLRLLGENPVALRLPSALASGLTAVIVFLLTARFATPFSALLASGIYLSTFLVLGVGTLALLDAFLALFLAGAIGSYYAALNEPAGRARLGLMMVCGACCAGAFLTKGFLGFLIPVLVVAPYLIARREWHTLLTSAWVPISTALALVAPWALLVHLREPDYWHYFFWVEHVQRFMEEDAQHAAPFWYYFALLPLLGWPWIWTLPAAVSGLRRLEENRSFVLYLGLWTLMPWLFFSLSSGKLGTYVLPCFAPLSMLLGIGLEQYSSSGRNVAWRIGIAAMGLLMISGVTAFVLSQRGLVAEPVYGPAETTRTVFVLGCLALGVGAAIVAVWARTRVWRAGAVAAAGIALFLPLGAALPERIVDNVMPHDFMPADALANERVILVADAPMFGAVAWYSKRDDVYMLQPGELKYGLTYADSRDRDLYRGGLQALIEANRRERDIFIICREVTDRELRSRLPERAHRAVFGRVAVWRIPAVQG